MGERNGGREKGGTKRRNMRRTKSRKGRKGRKGSSVRNNTRKKGGRGRHREEQGEKAKEMR